MEKSKLERYYNELKRIHQNFSEGYYGFTNGSNKKKRDSGERMLDNALDSFIRCVENDPELFNFLTETNNSRQGRSIYWDELKSFKYFGRDMQRQETK